MNSAEQPSASQLRADLAFADRMIAECQLHIARLKRTTAEMTRDGQDTSLARDVLESFVAALARHEAQRQLTVDLMERDAPGSSDLRPSRPPATDVSRRNVASRPPAPRRRRKR